MNTAALDTAKVFMTGRSQAVRLPKEYRFATNEVTIERQGDAIVLRPKIQSDEEWWKAMETVLNGFEGVDLDVERTRGDLREPESFD